jgi:hypothetical protein
VTIGPLDPAALLSTLSACDVEFVVIGATAVGVHAEVRSTGDVDIMVPIGDEPNKQARQTALEQLEAVRLTAQAGRSHDLEDVASLTAADASRRGTRRVRSSMTLSAGVDAQWATDLAGARVELFDPQGTVEVVGELLKVH